MARKRARVIPKNVLAQEELRRKYVEEPWPQKLILVKSTLDSNGGIRVRGSVTGLFYNLSYPYLYVDERDLSGLGDMIEKGSPKKAGKKHIKRTVKDAATVSGDKRTITKQDTSTDIGGVKPTGKRKRGRPRKSSRSTVNDPSNHAKDGKVSTKDNE